MHPQGCIFFCVVGLRHVVDPVGGGACRRPAASIVPPLVLRGRTGSSAPTGSREAPCDVVGGGVYNAPLQRADDKRQPLQQHRQPSLSYVGADSIRPPSIARLPYVDGRTGSSAPTGSREGPCDVVGRGVPQGHLFRCAPRAPTPRRGRWNTVPCLPLWGRCPAGTEGAAIGVLSYVARGVVPQGHFRWA